jgi:alanine racemase
MRPSQAVINLSNLKYNFLNIRKKINDAKVMAVVKADAYGHGVALITKALNSLGKNKPEYYAVAIADEAVELRKHNVKQPILVFDPFDKTQVNRLFEYNLIATVFSDEHLETLIDGQKKNGKKKSRKNRIRVHIKIDTGMNRLGINFNDAFDFIRKVSENKKFKIDGIYTHFATADERDKSFSYLQLEKFNSLIKKLDITRIKYGLIHAANSGAILEIPESYFDMVRPGITMFGCKPTEDCSDSISLKPVMSIISHVSSVKEINESDSVSYGRQFVADKKTKIVSVPFGYADGYYRKLSNRSKAIINGKLYPQIGAVTMDRTMFNIGDDEVKVGDKVILLGSDGKNEITLYELARLSETIPYEITCNINKRVPRVCVK